MTTLLAVNNYYYRRGGAEAVFLDHNRLFEAEGWRVVPFAMRHPRNLASPWADYFVEEIEYGRRYSLGDRLVRVPKVVYSFEARRRLAALLDRVRPDAAHAHNVYHHLSPSVLWALHARGVPTVLTLHDLKIACPAYTMLAPDGVCERCRGGRLYEVVRHRCLKGSLPLSLVAYAEATLHRRLRTYERCVARLVVPSRFYATRLAEWGIASAKLVHVPNFVAAGDYEPRYAPGRRFVYVGRLVREKGVATLIRAAARAGVGVRVIGAGPESQALQSLARTLAANVEFTGHLVGPALRDAIAGARAVVLPSEWYENAPLALLEAYALGKPVIGAHIGGIPELIREGETGTAFASGSVDELAARLVEFASRPDDQLAALGAEARRVAETEYSPRRYRERILDVYRDAGLAA